MPTKHSRLCSLHFYPSDFLDGRTDSNKSRDKQKSDKPLQRRNLKQGAVPSIFNSAPAYLSRPADIPAVTACITVKSDMTVVCSLAGNVIPALQYSDLLKGHLMCLSQLVNLMVHLKSWQTDPSSRSLQFSVLMAIDVLKTAQRRVSDSNSDKHRKITFITEQLQLVIRHKYGRHYSPQLIVFAFMLHAASSAAYKMLLDDNVMCLLSIR